MTCTCGQQPVSGIPGYESGSSDLEGLFDSPPDFVVNIIRQVASQAPVVAWLRFNGQRAAEAAIREIEEALFSSAPGAPRPPNPWIEGMLMPFLSPFMDGVKVVLRRKAKTVALKVGAVTGAAGLLVGALVAGTRKKKD